MSLIKPEFTISANMLYHMLVSNRNAFSLFLKVFRDMSVLIMWQAISHVGTISLRNLTLCMAL